MLDEGHDYVVAVKNNQPTLYQAFATLKFGEAVDLIKTKNRQKGRIEHRETYIYRCSRAVRANWIGAKRMIVVRRHGLREGKAYDEMHYYLSSIAADKAEYFADGIRKHWSIENNLHWVKDVQMNEDNAMIRNKNACLLLSVLKSLALNIYRLNGYDKYKPTVEIFTNRLDKLRELFRT